MKKTVFIIVFLAAVAGLAWLVWFRPPKPEEAEKKPDTEVPVHVGTISCPLSFTLTLNSLQIPSCGRV